MINLDRASLSLPPAAALERDATEANRTWLTEDGICVSLSGYTESDRGDLAGNACQRLADLFGRYRCHREGRVGQFRKADVPGAVDAWCGTADIRAVTGERLHLIALCTEAGDHAFLTLQVVWPTELSRALAGPIGDILDSYRLD